MAPSGQLMLIDGHALIYRAFHALPPLSTTKGEVTNAVFGFTSMVLKAIQELQPEYIACTFDRPKPTFRHEAFKEYKAQRPKMPSELFDQIRRVREVVDVLHLPVFELDGYEADDVIGTLAHQAAEQGVLATIVTGDLDTLQLIGSHVRVYAPRGRMSDIVIYDEAKVRERFAIEPIQTIDFKALKGDPSDNIPGVPGFGEKTASELVARYGSIEGIYEHLPELKGKQHDLLEEYEEQVRLGKRLATIVEAPGITLDLEACRRPEYDRSAAVELFRELEFNSLVPRLPRPAGATMVSSEATSGPLYGSAPVARQTSMFDVQEETLTPTLSQRERENDVSPPLGEGIELANKLRAAGSFAMRVVCSSSRAMECRLLGIAFGGERTAYLDLAEDGAALAPLKDVLEDEAIRKTGHDLKFDLLVLRRHGIELRGIAFDTSIAYFLASTNRTPNLKDVSLQKLDEELTSLSDLTGTGAKAVPLASLPVSQVAETACREADAVRRVAPVLERELKEKALHQLFLEVEL
ncbi:MAG TPA: 5'-3' exonuclease H3TH domain-containing protein, partial [Chloroflexota bacterium]